MRGYEPSPAQLRSGAEALTTIAADADDAVKNLDGYARRLAALPGRIREAIATTSTNVESTMLQEATAAADAVSATVKSLTHAANRARRQATELERMARAAESRATESRR